ncbi:TPA: hypothetical protein NRM86_001198 [Klebsiella pneumoniae]|uniref:hypothetical protein n=1 Tax=Klebsiella michiganensis TaxID=1134687 RepID=UPI002E7AC851|nr:hypothetical protein [Klebsiella michiganensis]MEE1967608.1 hypothetical protein [Klebsiella michiganensis]HCJ3179689.1 hypothetical protein [Klebsiella pneumoniae]
MNHTLSDSQLEAMIKSAVNSSGPLPPDEKFSQLVSALRELQERRKASAEPVAYLVCNGRLYQDRPFLSLSAARISVNDRNDGAEIKALCVIETLTETAE